MRLIYVIASIALLAGCAHYEYSIVAPPELSRTIPSGNDADVKVDPLEYRIRLLGSPRTFTKHGQCGMELSDFLPHLATCADDIAWVRSMHTDAFNHHPGQLMMNTGVPNFGRPSRSNSIPTLSSA